MSAPVLAQRGVALIAVLWLVAAMTLIITGIVAVVRNEAQTAGQQRQAVIASTQADAAILLALQTLNARQNDAATVLEVIAVEFQGQRREVLVTPLNGLIDLNRATVALFAAMYQHAGGLDSAQALTFAQATVELRQSTSAKGMTQGFEATEDLMRLPAMTFALYAKIVGLVTADLEGGSGRVNPLVAPVGVLQILTRGDAARARVLAAGRGSDPKLMDTSFFSPELIEMASSRSLQLEVQVKPPDGSGYRKAWRVHLSTDPRSGLPWRVLATQQSFEHLTAGNR